MLRAFALAAGVTGREEYREIAEKNASFLLERLVVDGRLRRSYKDGQARFNGYLEDYACVADGLVALYETTFETRWLKEAASLADAILGLFWEQAEGTFYDTAADHEELVTRPRDVYDNATPSGNSVAVDVLLKLSILLDREGYRERAGVVLENLSGGMSQIPGAFGRLLSALDFYLSTPYEVAIIGERRSPGTKTLLETVYSSYLPNKVMAGRSANDEEATQLVPLLAERPMRGGEPTAYVCVNYACQSPTTEPTELARQLGIG
jgi:uncharacterized protein YyaL (SSP411 family)